MHTAAACLGRAEGSCTVGDMVQGLRPALCADLRFAPPSWRVSPIMDEWTAECTKELDFQCEADNIVRVAAAMQRSGLNVIIPQLVPEFTRTKVRRTCAMCFVGTSRGYGQWTGRTMICLPGISRSVEAGGDEQSRSPLQIYQARQSLVVLCTPATQGHHAASPRPATPHRAITPAPMA